MDPWTQIYSTWVFLPYVNTYPTFFVFWLISFPWLDSVFPPQWPSWPRKFPPSSLPTSWNRSPSTPCWGSFSWFIEFRVRSQVLRARCRCQCQTIRRAGRCPRAVRWGVRSGWAVIAFCFTFRGVHGFSSCFVGALTFRARPRSSSRLIILHPSPRLLSRFPQHYRLIHPPYLVHPRDQTTPGSHTSLKTVQPSSP